MFHTSRPENKKITKLGMPFLQEDAEDDGVDDQRQGRREHRPEEPEERVLVLDLDLGADQVDQQLAATPDLGQPPGDAEWADTTRVVLTTPPGSAIGEASGPVREVAAPGGAQGRGPTPRGGGRRFERHAQLPPTWAADRSMTWSMKPYSRASWAVNQRSRSESVSIRSTG